MMLELVDIEIFDKLYTAKYPEPGRYEYEKLIDYYTKKYKKYKDINAAINNPRNYDKYKRYSEIQALENSFTREKIDSILKDDNKWESQRVRLSTIKALEIAIDGIDEYQVLGENSKTEGIKNKLLKTVAIEFVSNLDIWKYVEDHLLIKELDAIQTREDYIAFDNLCDVDENTGRRLSFSDTVLKRAKEKAKSKDGYGHIPIEKSTKTLLSVIRDYKMLTWDETIFYIIEMTNESERFNESIKFSRQVYGNQKSKPSTPVTQFFVDKTIENSDIDDIDKFFRNYRYLKLKAGKA